MAVWYSNDDTYKPKTELNQTMHLLFIVRNKILKFIFQLTHNLFFVCTLQSQRIYFNLRTACKLCSSIENNFKASPRKQHTNLFHISSFFFVVSSFVFVHVLGVIGVIRIKFSSIVCLVLWCSEIVASSKLNISFNSASLILCLFLHYSNIW